MKSFLLILNAGIVDQLKIRILLAGNYSNVNIFGNVFVQSQLCFTKLYNKTGLSMMNRKFKSWKSLKSDAVTNGNIVSAQKNGDKWKIHYKVIIPINLMGNSVR